MKIIEKTYKGPIAPESTSVFWVNTSGDKPVLKIFIKEEWRTLSL